MMSKSIHHTIVVPIDLHGINRATLETLVHIARQLDSSLLGLLLEDIRLQQVADLPFTTEISLDSGRERSLLRDHLSQRHSQVGNETRTLLHELATRNQVALNFEDAAGTRWHTALERDGQSDIFFPARQRWHPTTLRHSTSSGIIRRLGLVVPGNTPPQSLLLAAKSLLRAGMVGDIYLLCSRPLLPEQLQELYRPGHQVRVQGNVRCDAQGIIVLILHSPYDLLLLPRESLRNIPHEALDAALDIAGSQVMVLN